MHLVMLFEVKGNYSKVRATSVGILSIYFVKRILEQQSEPITGKTSTHMYVLRRCANVHMSKSYTAAYFGWQLGLLPL